ncbi:MORN repeat-containing protein [Microcoleus sp. OTE_8_concoct_300]|uniref:MORN repeat-containing protein n=1 Tax=Microcoleus sp. OTE_8_concoct_300 TaxID=2964710 RepID=UPI00403FBA54
MTRKLWNDILLTIFCIIGAVVLLFLARGLVFFILRPLTLWTEVVFSQLTSGNLLEIQITGIEWLDIILRVLIVIPVIIIVGLWQVLANADDPEIRKIKGIPGTIVWNIIWGAFISIGYGIQSWVYRFGYLPAVIIIVPTTLFLCFFNTILDYQNLVSLVIYRVSDSPYMDIFTDRAVKYINNKIYITEFVKWTTQDAVAINNFFDYWFYTLRASILGFRFEGIWQWLVAFPINVIASIWYFCLGYLHILAGINTERIELDEELKLIIYPRNHKIPRGSIEVVLFSLCLSLMLFLPFQNEIKQCIGWQAGFCPLTSEITYDGGGRYKGDTLNGKPHGKGVFISAKGDRYEGEIKNGQYEGKGLYTDVKGHRYEGEFKNGQYKGKGVFTYANGERYEGEWSNDKRNGQGVLSYANGDRLEGEWKDDSYVKGVYIYKNGDRYEGEWSNEKRNGKGTLTYADGKRYVGDFRDGEINGRGNMTYPKNNQTQSYDGEWKNGNYNGVGTIIWSDGDRYSGNWLDGKFYGYGIYTWANGNRFEGQWQNNKANGLGIMIYSDGTRKSGTWKNGELITPSFSLTP